MMNSQKLMEILDSCIAALNKGDMELKILGLKKAQAEKAYRVKQAQEILKLMIDKQPENLIMELVKGNEEIAELRLQRDVAESAYCTCISAIKNLRLEIEAITNKLKWVLSELNNL